MITNNRDRISATTQQRGVSARARVDAEGLLNWVYGVQRAAGGVGLERLEAEADGFDWYGSSGDGCLAVERLAKLNARVDRSAGGGYSIDEDAIVVDQFVGSLGDGLPGLLIRYAKVARVPGWYPVDAVRIEPVWQPRNAAGHLELGELRRAGASNAEIAARVPFEREYDHNRNLVWARIRVINRPENVAAARETYRRWHAGLVAVAFHFMVAGLHAWEVTLSRRPAEPWLDRREIRRATARLQFKA